MVTGIFCACRESRGGRDVTRLRLVFGGRRSLERARGDSRAERVISVAEVIEVIDIAAEVEDELACLTGAAPGAPSLLAPLSRTMRLDLEG